MDSDRFTLVSSYSQSLSFCTAQYIPPVSSTNLSYRCPFSSTINPLPPYGIFLTGHKHMMALFILKDIKKYLDCICPPGVHPNGLLHVKLLRIPRTHTFPPPYLIPQPIPIWLGPCYCSETALSKYIRNLNCCIQ